MPKCDLALWRGAKGEASNGAGGKGVHGCGLREQRSRRLARAGHVYCGVGCSRGGAGVPRSGCGGALLAMVKLIVTVDASARSARAQANAAQGSWWNTIWGSPRDILGSPEMIDPSVGPDK